MISEEQVKKAIRILIDDKEHHATTLNWAINYCKAAQYMTGHELGVQCLYILNNISSWRHVLAKEVRMVLKQFAKEN